MVAEKDASRREHGTAYYVYGIVRAGDTPRPADVVGVDPEFPVTVLEHDGIAAIVSQVSLAEFSEDTLKDNLNQMPWLEAKVRAHEHVLERFLGRSALVPMRFCTIYRSEEHVRQVLARRRESFVAALRHLDGKTEWGVKSYVETAALDRWIETHDERAQGLREENTAKPAGEAYFARKKLEEVVRRERAAIVASCARESHAALSAAASEARANPLQRKELAQHSGEMLLNGAYLVEHEREDEFHRARSELESRYRALGVTFELTGPWAPYNFVPPQVAEDVAER